jgi:hypothetical protein
MARLNNFFKIFKILLVIDNFIKILHLQNKKFNY